VSAAVVAVPDVARSFHNMSILTAIRQTIKGGSVIDDWLGAGGQPVSQEVADQRAQCCISGNDGGTCPHNKAPLWWEKAKGSIAQAILDMLAIKNEVAMEVHQEEKLSMCSQCGCCLKLKVWTPLIHVRKVLDQKTVTELPRFCWMKKEIANL
jgi:hypothetical protein